LGVVYHADALDMATGGAKALPVVESVELLAWSSPALRVWLRNALRGEPSRILLDWLMTRSGGVPAKVAAEVDRLSGSGWLAREGDGGWTLVPALLGRSRPVRKPLPVPLTELIGRQQETAQVARLISEGPLVTLVGPGGIGKTRLSLAVAAAVADTYADGVVFVSLAAASSTDDVLSTLAHALDVTELPGQAPVEAVTAHLAEQSTLLVIDNVDDSADAADVVADLLTAAPGLTVLLASRQRLGVYGEQVYHVPPLALPNPAALPSGQAGVTVALAASPALALFVARARAAAYQFAATTETLGTLIDLCRRLDGLPLAIELAAAHADTLTPAQMLAELTHRLDLPGPGRRGVPERQRTLRAAIEWSVDRLTVEERTLFVSLGAFRGGATLDAISAVCAHEPELAKRLATLVDRSLVRAEPDTGDGTRYALLETMVAYTTEQLQYTPGNPRQRHAAYFAELAGTAGTELTGPTQGVWHARLEREYANLGKAFGDALDRADTTTAARLALGLWRFWRSGAYLRDGRRWLDRLLCTGPAGGVRAQLLHAAAVLAGAQDDHETASRLATESRDLALADGDRRTVAQAANALGIAALAAGDHRTARGFFSEALTMWQELCEPLGMAMAHGNLTKVALRLGEISTASRHADQCLALDRAQGNTRGIMLGLLCLGEIEQSRDDRQAARTALSEALTLARSLGDLFGEAMAMHQLSLVEAQDGRAADALAHMTAATALRRDIGDREDLAHSLDALAWLLSADRPVLAARLLGAALALRTRHRLAEPANVGGVTRTSLLTDLRASLGADDLTAAIETGSWVGLDAVVDDAIDVVA
jgi:predicted ATPase